MSYLREKKKRMKTERVKIKFSGDSHEVDLGALVGFLMKYSELIGEVDRRVGEPGRAVKINASAIERGSFIVELNLHETILETLFTPTSVGYMANLVTIAGGVHMLYKWMKGKAVDGTRNAEMCKRLERELKNQNAKPDEIINVYNDRAIRNIVRDEFKAARKAPEVDGVEVSDGVGNVFDADRAEMDAMADYETDGGEVIERTVDEEAVLVVTSLGFEPGIRWRFVYHGIPIVITVREDALMKQIDSGARFGKGDSIRVLLSITQVYDKGKRAYVNQSYKIKEFDELYPTDY